MNTKTNEIQTTMSAFSYCGNSFRINNQNILDYPLTLIIHDACHLELVLLAQEIFAGNYPLGYIGTSPWPEIILNQKTMDIQKQFPDRLANHLKIAEYQSREDIVHLLSLLTEDIRRTPNIKWTSSLNREWAEWTNLSFALPEEDPDNRILLVGDSISVGYGSLVQELMPQYHIDLLNTSEGIHHPNFLRLLQIALNQHSYQTIHINNGIHLHGQTFEQYEQNLIRVFEWIHLISPNTKIIFATTTPVSRKIVNREPQGTFDPHNFTMGGCFPLDKKDADSTMWIVDHNASAIYQLLNDTAKNICSAYNIPVNDLYNLCIMHNLQKTDKIHFQESAYWQSV
ncbi:MAG: SGNH/GDSL hydrolase family protein [Lachnospiraceae bacterium]|nr:SGNH/GDSL hydrolase family protein [Lachnospiraceae bacterium]